MQVKSCNRILSEELHLLQDKLSDSHEALSPLATSQPTALPFEPFLQVHNASKVSSGRPASSTLASTKLSSLALLLNREGE